MSTNFLSNSNIKKKVRGAEFNKATSSFLGTVRADGTTILIDSSGTISVVPVTTATSSATGTIRPDNTSITVTSGVIAVNTQNIIDNNSLSSVNGTIRIATSSNGFGARTVSTGTPTGGNDGDIWYKYV